MQSRPQPWDDGEDPEVRGPLPPREEFARRVLIALALASLFVAVGLLLWLATEVVLLAFAGLLIGLLLKGMAGLLTRYASVPQGWALAAVVLALVLVIGFGGWFLASSIASQFEQLSTSLTESIRTIRERLREREWGRNLLQAPATRELLSGKMDVFGRLGGLFSTASGALANLVVIVFVGLYGAIDPGTYRRGLLSLIPPERRGRVAEVLDLVATKLRWWLLGRIANMTAVGVVTTVGLWLLGVPLALALGVIAFFLDFIPYIGPLASAIPALLVGITISPMTAAYVAMLYVGVQGLESYILTPLVQQSAVKLPPALTILAQVLMGMMAGVFGLALATPMTAVGLLMIQKFYVEDTLGDRASPGRTGDGDPAPPSPARATGP